MYVIRVNIHTLHVYDFRFSKIEVKVSPPLVSFRETIVVPPKLDKVNEVSNNLVAFLFFKFIAIVTLESDNELS